jgi:uncharacterized protein (UPF0305 family)
MNDSSIDGLKVEVDNIKSDIKELKESSKQHDKDIINLKESNIELKIYIKQIFEKIDEVKAMIQTKKDEKQDNVDGNDRLDKFIDIMLETFQNNNNNENEIKFFKTKQFWAVTISVITALCSILVAIFK